MLGATTILLVAALRLSAQDNSSKTGGFCFRVDDQHPTILWTQYDALFKKYGCNFSFAANLGLTPLDVDALQALISRGNEMTDHTADHSTFYFTDPDSPLYKDAEGVDHYTFGIDRVCLSIDRIDTTGSPGDFYASIRNGYAFSRKIPKSVMDYPVLGIYSPERRLFLRIINEQEDTSGVVLGLSTAWGEPVPPDIQFDNARFQLIHLNDVHMTDAAMALLAGRTIDLCKHYKLPIPTSWIQPGGSSPYLDAPQVKDVWARYNYTSAATYPHPALRCFNEVDPAGDRRFAMQSSLDLDSASLSYCRNMIADNVARHCVSIGVSHFSCASKNSAPGEWKSYLDRTDSLLSWCKRMSILVKTYKEWARILYDTPQNPYVNVFPRLNVDLDENGRPDGFSPDGDVLDRKDGVAESGGVSYRAGPGGKICSVYGLGGLEKGLNTFSIYTKGKTGSIKVIVTFHSASDLVQEYIFPATAADWKKYDTALVVPNVSTCDIQIQSLNPGTAPIKVSGMSLAKAADRIALTACTVTASAGPNGTIVPSGIIPVILGGSQSFTITPNIGYKIVDVIVDSVSAGPVLNYTFSKVTTDHKISVSFRQIKKPVVATVAATELTPTSVRFNGAVNPNGLVTNYRFEFGLTASYGVATPTLSATAANTVIQVSGPMDYLSPGTTYHYRIAATNSDGSAFGNDTVFTTTPNNRKVTAIAGPNGTITPSGIIPVIFGGRQSFSITPNEGYCVAKVLVDDSLVSATTSYDLSNVTKDETISALFIALPTTSVDQTDSDIPHAFALYQNYPNPFNPSTTIRFAVPNRGIVTLRIFNVLGTEVAALIAREIGPGYFSARWDADVPSGTYFYELRTREFVETKKMILLR